MRSDLFSRVSIIQFVRKHVGLYGPRHGHKKPASLEFHKLSVARRAPTNRTEDENDSSSSRGTRGCYLDHLAYKDILVVVPAQFDE